MVGGAVVIVLGAVGMAPEEIGRMCIRIRIVHIPFLYTHILYSICIVFDPCISERDFLGFCLHILKYDTKFQGKSSGCHVDS